MRGLVIALWVSVAMIVAYWVLWFVDRGLVASLDTDAYVAFENAFPISDAWLAIACGAAAITLQRGHRTRTFWIICAGSAALYLTGMDVLYDLENRVYAAGTPAIPEILINLASLTLAVWSLRVGYRLLLERADA